MRRITVEQAEREFRARLEAVRQGASFTVVDNHVALARLAPPPPQDHARALAWMALKRHLGNCAARTGPRLWSRAALYRGEAKREGGGS